MKIGSAHLTYCTNIHSGESWAEVFENLKTHVREVKARVCPTEPFGVGLRLSAVAAREVLFPGRLDELREFLSTAGLYVFTLNGFPYGPFHGQSVKSQVYRPDWQREERAQYTQDLVDVLTGLLPEGQCGSISTVPGAFRPEAQGDAACNGIARRLQRQVVRLQELKRQTGQHLSLALEPEPYCLLETTPETIQFFEGHLLNKQTLGETAREEGISAQQVEAAVRDHLGVCLDTCHAAIEFECATDSLSLMKSAGIPISKLQLSTGLQLVPTESNLQSLQAYDEDVYLHQVVARTAEGKLLRFVDLPDALSNREARSAEQWRVHFHVPVHEANPGVFQNTQRFLIDTLKLQRVEPVTKHLEVETYTWDVLPPEQRSGSVVESIARELTWVREHL